jgi:hypothetical protein
MIHNKEGYVRTKLKKACITNAITVGNIELVQLNMGIFIIIMYSN